MSRIDVTDELIRFQEWFEQRRRQSFKAAYGDIPFRDAWGRAEEHSLRSGWMARAAVDVESK